MTKNEISKRYLDDGSSLTDSSRGSIALGLVFNWGFQGTLMLLLSNGMWKRNWGFGICDACIKDGCNLLSVDLTNYKHVFRRRVSR